MEAIGPRTSCALRPPPASRTRDHAHPSEQGVEKPLLTAGPSGPGGPSTSMPWARGIEKLLAKHIFKVTLATGLESPTLYLFLNVSGVAGSGHPRAEGLSLSLGIISWVPIARGRKIQILCICNTQDMWKQPFCPAPSTGSPSKPQPFSLGSWARPRAHPALWEKSSSSGRSCF